ncbi:hypothetical protein ORJ04_18875 [Rheinheimera baltica]|uniref:Solute-binding protein family 3/N-terminal domain-containing protein n=2 Tax=Rheinheimera baltica TaxID=67576 RepID=A0ABT9I4J9_9GAMM|nr:hypothetical protein [Rheinheimera baltica]MDP5138018.1 hypothetical protein [Rheinheimera baltica]MDP5149536.1 hypothetical protein [Rheinheimera baltica]
MKSSVLAVLLLACSCALAQPVRIGIPLGDSALRQKLQQQLTAAYTALGYQPQFIALPSQRRFRLLKDGLIDADLLRICQLDETHAELLVVPVPLDTLRLNAYSLSADKLVNWQQRNDLLISHIRGFKMAEQQEFAGVRVLVNSDEQAFGLMLQGRVEIVLEDGRTAERFLTQQPELAGIAMQQVADFDVCHILNHNWQALLTALTRQLQQ